MAIERGSEVKFQHPMTQKWMESRVYDVCFQGDKSTFSVLVKVGEGTLIWRRLLDCQEVS